MVRIDGARAWVRGSPFGVNAVELQFGQDRGKREGRRGADVRGQRVRERNRQRRGGKLMDGVRMSVARGEREG